MGLGKLPEAAPSASPVRTHPSSAPENVLELPLLSSPPEVFIPLFSPFSSINNTHPPNTAT